MTTTYMTTNIELAYRTPGYGWKRRTFHSHQAMERFIERLDDDVEIRWSDDDGC
jgi:hypothetical protein